MPYLGNWQVVREPRVDECAEAGCPASPNTLFRISGGQVTYLGLCRMHVHMKNQIPAGFSCEEISEKEWIVGEVMDS